MDKARKKKVDGHRLGNLYFCDGNKITMYFFRILLQ